MDEPASFRVKFQRPDGQGQTSVTFIDRGEYERFLREVRPLGLYVTDISEYAASSADEALALAAYAMGPDFREEDY